MQNTHLVRSIDTYRSRTPALPFPNHSRRSVLGSDDRFDFRVRYGTGSRPATMTGYK